MIIIKTNTFAENLKILRKRENMSMDELASMINVSKQSISKYENELGEPNFHTLVEVSKAFNCSLDELVFGNITQVPTNPIEIKLVVERLLNDFKHEIFNYIDDKFSYQNDISNVDTSFSKDLNLNEE